jgi:transposase
MNGGESELKRPDLTPPESLRSFANRAVWPIQLDEVECAMAKRQMSTFERLKRGERISRRDRRQVEARLRREDPGLEIVHTNVAGVDVGSKSHFVAVDPRVSDRPVREFGSWTPALHEMAEWLKECGVQRVVMQTTGVYWIAVQDVLEKAGFEVAVVDARGTRNLPGRKSDVQECQWIRRLDIYGLLRKSFQIAEINRAIRNIWRTRQRLVRDCGRSIQRMQKALTTMNVQLANTISDITGKSGMAILRAILDGERNPWVLARLCDERIQASEEEVAHSLQGNWREDVLFELNQVVEIYDFQQRQIAACDLELEKYMKAQATRPTLAKAVEDQPAESSPKKRGRKKSAAPKPRKNQPAFALEAELTRLMGVDLTRIDGINVMTAQTIYAELGPDLSAFPTESHFASWLKLAPTRDVSGGKVIKHLALHSRNRVANALRMAAESLSHSNSYLGARYRSLRGRLSGLQAIKAMARYLACLVYRMLTKGQDWVDRGAHHFEQKRQQRELNHLQRKAHSLGLQLIPAVGA